MGVLAAPQGGGGHRWGSAGGAGSMQGGRQDGGSGSGSSAPEQQHNAAEQSNTGGTGAMPSSMWHLVPVHSRAALKGRTGLLDGWAHVWLAAVAHAHVAAAPAA